MDPFARPDDELRFALDDGTLHRNVHGDSTCAGADVVAFGVSGISQLDGAYVQNLKGPPPTTTGSMSVSLRSTAASRCRAKTGCAATSSWR